MFGQESKLNKFFLESRQKTRIAVSVSGIGLLLFVITASLFPFKDQLFSLLYPKPASKATEGGFITFTKQYLGSDGTLIASEEKRITLTGQPQAFINGERIEDIEPVSGPVIVDEREEHQALKKYIVELTSKSLGEENLELKSKGVGDSDRISRVKSLKGTKNQERQSLKAEIGKTIGKKLVKGDPKKDERRIFQEFDTSFHGFSLKLLPDEVEKVKNLKGVKRVMIDEVVKTTIDSSVPLIKANEAWPLIDGKGAPLTGYGVKIGIIDTGVDYTHPDLGGCFGPGCKVEGGYDFVNNDSNPMDDHGHGTHVAATAGGKGVASDGTKLYGVAPDATIYAYKVMNSGGSGSSGVIIAGIDRCVDPNQDGDFSDRLDVCSMSLGGPGGPDDPMSQASDNAMRNGVVITIAAGNSGPSYQTVGSPGTSRESITVGAACKPEDIGRSSACATDIASFSSRGPVKWVDTNGVSQEMVKPDIVSPGVNICAAEWGTWLSDRRCKDDKHIAIAGTSMATPHVAGMAALLRQAVPQATPADIKIAIKTKAIPYSGFDENTQGKGLINTIETLKYLSPDLDFSSKLGANPFSWSVTTDITAPVYNASQTFTLTNNTATETTAAISVQNVPPGITITPSVASLVIPANATATFSAALTANHDSLTSGQTYSTNLLVNSPIKQLNISIAVTTPNRIKVGPDINFGIDPPDTPGAWTSTKEAQVTNLQNAAGTYNLSVDCCYGPKGKTTEGISLSLANSTVSLPASATATFSASISLDNNLLPNGTYTGNIIVSSSLQKPLYIPFNVLKFFSLVMTYPPTEIPKFIGLHDRGIVTAVGAPGSNPSITFLMSQRYPALDIIGYFGEDDGLGNGLVKFVVNEAVSLDGDDSLFIDPTSAVNNYTTSYVGPNGETFDQSFPYTAFQGAMLKFKTNALPPVSFSWSNYKPINFKFNNVSSNYVFSLLAQPNYTSLASDDPEIEKSLHIQHILDKGINSSGVLTNSPGELKLVPLFAHPAADASPVLRLRLNPCRSGNGGIRLCYQFNEYQLYASKNYRHDLYIYPVADPVEEFANAIYYQIPLLLTDTYNTLVTGPSFIYGANGLFRWKDNYVYGNTKPVFPITSANSQRLDIGLYPYNFDFYWAFSPDSYYFGNRKSGGCHYLGQEGDDIKGTIVNFQVQRDGIKTGEGVVDNCSSQEITPFINNIPGNYEIEISGNPQINGVNTTENFKASFVLPSSFTGTQDIRPPTTTGLDFLSGGVSTQVIDPTRNHTLRFTLDPIPNPYPSGPDSITSATVRIMTDVSGWQPLSLVQDATTKEYSADVPVVSGANLYTFELTASDSFNNLLTYTFQLPKGTVPGEISPSPTPTPCPTNLIQQLGNLIGLTTCPTPTPSPTPEPTPTPTPSPSPTPTPTPLPTPTPSPSPSPTSPPGQNYGNITGTVYSSAGGTVAGVKISTAVAGTRKTYYTNSIGIYSITNLPPGTYSLTFQAKGYVNQKVSVAVTANTTTTRNVTMTKR